MKSLRYSIFLACLLSGATGLAADDYLQALEQEAGATMLDKPVASSETRKISTERLQLRKLENIILPTGLSQNKLKLFLYKENFDVYTQFQELGWRHKRDLYQFYNSLSRGNLQQLSARILQLSEAQTENH